MRIDLCVNNTFLLEITKETADDEQFYWRVWQGEEYANSSRSDYQIRVQDCEYLAYYGFSEYFTITEEKYLQITSPEVNSSFTSGDKINITWKTDTPCTYVEIRLTHEEEIVKKINDTLNDGEFLLKIPYGIPTSENYSVRVIALDGSCRDTSELFYINGRKKTSIYSFNIVIVISIIAFLSISIIFKWKLNYN